MGTKYLISLVLITLLFSCNKKLEKSNTQESKEISKPILDEVVFISNDTTKSLSMNIWSNPFQLKPDLIDIGGKSKNNIIIIPTDSIVQVSINHSYIYHANAIFHKGDTIVIENKDMKFNNEKIEYPYYIAINDVENPYEVNFNYYISKKTPTISTFKFYSLFKKRKNWKNPSSANDVYLNIINTSDSLLNKNLISEEFRNLKQQEAKIFIANIKLNEAINKNLKINIDSLGVSLNDTSLSDNKLYINYLISVLKYKPFSGIRATNKASEIYDLLQLEDTFPKEIEVQIKDVLLTQIYSREKNKFKSYFEKLESPVLINKFKTQIENEKEDFDFMNKIKNSTGKLVKTSNDTEYDYKYLIEKEKGKIILVDFWASWCAPCRSEMPYSKVLQKELDTSKFKIISISTDKSFRAWTKASQQEGMLNDENSYLLLNADKSSLIEDFKINTIPRYLLYDSEGKLINNDAPRPSDQKLRQLIIENF